MGRIQKIFLSKCTHNKRANQSGFGKELKSCPVFKKRVLILFAGLCLVLMMNSGAYAKNLSIQLKALSGNGQFVAAEGGGGRELIANRSQAAQWETFTLVDENRGSLTNKDIIYLKAYSGHFVGATYSGTRELRADRPGGGRDARFSIELVNPGSDYTIRDGALIYLRAAYTGKIVAAENGGGTVLRANRDAVGDWEKFKIRIIGDPPMMRLSAPFRSPGNFSPPTAMDHGYAPSSKDIVGQILDPLKFVNCLNYKGQTKFPACYTGHTGTDYMLKGWFLHMDLGEHDVVAAAGGIVIKTGDGAYDKCFALPKPGNPNNIHCGGGDPDHANFVIIRQDDGLSAMYWHLQRGTVAVREEQRVECGQLLGKVGSAGISVSPHLHFEIRNRLSDAQEQDTNGFRPSVQWFNNSGITPIDPYLPVGSPMWASIGAFDIPNPICGQPSLNQCQQEVINLVCNNNLYKALCSAVDKTLDSLCAVQPVYNPITKTTTCPTKCSAVCSRTVERIMIPCN